MVIVVNRRYHKTILCEEGTGVTVTGYTATRAHQLFSSALISFFKRAEIRCRAR
jgi:hypothetical protein